MRSAMYRRQIGERVIPGHQLAERKRRIRGARIRCDENPGYADDQRLQPPGVGVNDTPGTPQELFIGKLAVKPGDARLVILEQRQQPRGAGLIIDCAQIGGSVA